MKPRSEQPFWLYAMSCGLESFHTFSVLMEGPRFAIVKEPGRRYMSGQQSAYGSVDYIFVDKTADPRGGTGLSRNGLSLQRGGRLTETTKLFWKTLVEAPDRETVDKLRKTAQEEKAILKLSVADIAAARVRAKGLDTEYFSKLEINWKKANQDKREGRIHAWAASGEYLGQFKTHERAIASGAAVTQFLRIWFTWGEEGVAAKEGQ